MDSPNSGLCSYCRDFDVQELLVAAEASPAKSNIDERGRLRSPQKGIIREALPAFFKHRPTLASVKSAAENCDLCRTIWQEYSRHKQPVELTDVAITKGVGNEQVYIGTLDWDTGFSAIPHLVVAQLGPPPYHAYRQLACFEVCAEFGDSQYDHAHLLARLQASSAAEPQIIKLATEWLSACRSQHKICGQYLSQSPRMPTRLLELSEDLSESKIRLVQGNECERPYVALSYCWGPDKELRLTHESEQDLRAGIDLSDFPATLKDSIVVTRSLGFKYIWIDALCIFQDQHRQDSRDDWAREAGRMRDVYMGSVVTIETASATRGNEGFLTERTSSKPYCTLSWRGENGAVSVYLRPHFDITDNQLLGSRIFTRGWTLQERLLAPRTLSFGRQQMSFECAHGYVDEAGNSTLLPRVTEGYLSKAFMLQLRQERGFLMHLWRSWSRSVGLPPVVTLFTHKSLSFNIGWSSYGELDLPGKAWATYYHYWRSIVTKYSERQLTNSEDRLPALSGLAKEFQRATGDSYVAGMWKQELLWDLAWKWSSLYGDHEDGIGGIPADDSVNEPFPGSRKDSPYIAPSWSWASVQGRIIFFLGTYNITRSLKKYAKIKKVHVEPRYSSDPTGSLVSGYLILTAPFLLLPDIQIPCATKSAVKHLHHSVRERYLYGSKGQVIPTEFWQHHKPHHGQKFGLVKLFHEHGERTTTTKLLEVLLVESCETGGWRRLGCFSIQLVTLRQLQDEQFQFLDVNDEADKKYMDRLQRDLEEIDGIAREVAEGPWKTETLTLY